MARTILTDFLQSHCFWLMDVAPIEPLALPLFTPTMGFSSITAPEVTAETQEITEGNWPFRRKVVKSANVGDISLQRGVTFYDADFWRWIMSAIYGDTGVVRLNPGQQAPLGGPTPRRDLLLISFFPRNPFGTPEAANAAMTAGLGAALTNGGYGQALIGASVAATLAPGPFHIAARVPAKAWLLHGCLPTRYKTGSDFDATSGQISIAELDFAVEGVEEISLAA